MKRFRRSNRDTKTGDDSRPGLWMALSALVWGRSGSFGILAVVKRKEKKEEEQA